MQLKAWYIKIKNIGLMAMAIVLGLFIMSAQETLASTLPAVHENVRTEQVAKGLTYEVRGRLTAKGWVNLHVIKMELSEPTLILDTLYSKDHTDEMETLVQMTAHDVTYVSAVSGTMKDILDGSEIDENLLLEALDGEEVLLQSGEKVGENNKKENERMARSVYGVTVDRRTLIFMVADYNQSSIGATHEEMQDYLLDYGVVDALYIDEAETPSIATRGLGDFTLSQRNVQMDDAIPEATVGIGIRSEAPATEAYNLMIKVDRSPYMVSKPIGLRLLARDMNYNPIAIDSGQIAWSMSGGFGTIGNNTFIPMEGGKTTLTAYYQGKRTSITLNISDPDVKDPLYEALPGAGYTVNVFGTTVKQNRLLDDIVMRKVYETMNAASYGIFTGETHIDGSKLTKNHYIYKNQYSVLDMEGARLISLAMGSGSMVMTDETQWNKLKMTLATTAQNSIIILGTKSLIHNEKGLFYHESRQIHELLKEFASKSGKNIFYINAGAKVDQNQMYDGVRYIDLNGLLYQVEENNSVNLYDSFQTLSFIFSGSKMTYRLTDLYPKTTVSR
ncbi:phosphodiester glycosidase family protein [Petrocella sp. FN5]|uniref:phosphodiester glycosidase family protein n=1 Tax=Petrocella sp. FN5 TaxID=3032002 RepID=UPI0023DA4A1B|nr:phosphodiester glycosidase family protein [Petrocella sp. FN5]MDF1617238.1 phosphodiester glycosidase family protein [Petrocella sp. FN5]